MTAIMSRRPGGVGRLVSLLLVLAVLAPWYPLLLGSGLPVPDDIFTSDLAEGDLPLRVEAGRLLRSGEWPLWITGIWTGFPLMVAEPFSLALFAFLPPALALGWYIALWLIIAALGAYALARQAGASRAGAFLAGYAYSWSGCVVSQIRHPSILAIVALFPVALFCIERAAGGGLELAAARAQPLRRRLLWLSGFAGLFGLQLLTGFPQSAYYAALVYVALVAARCLWLLRPVSAASPAGRAAGAGLACGAAAAIALGGLVGLAELLPLRELGTLSDRTLSGTFAWATEYGYWPRDVLSFLLPYANGDISNLTYRGTGIFWEDFGYVGLATVLLAVVAGVGRIRRFPVAFWVATGGVAFALVLGKATPLFKIAFHVIPGMSAFRFPTRFLFVVELALALLGGLGLTWLQALLTRPLSRGRFARVPVLVAAAIATATVADLVHHNRRQVPIADAGEWLAPPATAAAILASGQGGRVYAPRTMTTHRIAFSLARGWSGPLGPYLRHRGFLQPNSNLLHGIPALNGYSGIGPRWLVDLIGDHNRGGLVEKLHLLDASGTRVQPVYIRLLEALSVRWLLLPQPYVGEGLEQWGDLGGSFLHRLTRTLPRARIVDRARLVPTAEELRTLLLRGEIDLGREIVLHDPAAAGLIAGLPEGDPGVAGAGEARLVVDRATEVVVEAVAPRGGLLVVADTWYPGWEATVDGRPAPILRANLAHRAVSLPPGSHRVAFAFRPRSTSLGLALSVLGVVTLGIASAVLARRRRPAAP